MGNMIDVLTDQMDNIASSAVESAPFDKGTHGRIIEVLDGNKYTVKLSDGTEKSVLSLTSDSFAKDDVVVISALQNDPKNSYILGKPGVSKTSPSGYGDMAKGVYDTNDNGIVDNAEKVNGHTVLSDVPADTVFFNYTPVNKSGDAMSGGLTSPTLIATNYFRTPSLVGEGDTSTYYHRMDAGFAGHNYWAWYDYGGEYRFYINTTGTLEGAKLIGTIKDGKGWVGNVEGNVTGDASTVNNHTVNKDVPSNAAFTDTTYVDATASVHGLMSSSDKTKLDGVATGANNYSLPVATSGILGGVKSGTDITVDSSGNVSVANNSHNHTVSNVTGLQTALDAKIATSLLGTNNGVAQLGSDGKVPSAQLPSYVDDVLEFSGYANFPSTGETGKIYVDTTTNRTYRWSGSIYTEISSSLALGETSSTAYAGDKGKAVTDALASHKNNTSNPHNVTASQVGLGIFETTATNIKMNGNQGVGVLSTVARADHVHPVDTSRAPVSHTHTVSSIVDLTATAAELNALDGITASTTELNYIDGVTSNIQTQLDSKANTSSLATVATSGSYSDLSNQPDIPVISDGAMFRANDTSTPVGSVEIDANLLDGRDSSYFINLQITSAQPTSQRNNDVWFKII